MPSHDRILLLNARYALLATNPSWNIAPDTGRIIGVDALTAHVLEARVALEACRAA